MRLTGHFPYFFNYNRSLFFGTQVAYAACTALYLESGGASREENLGGGMSGISGCIWYSSSN